MSRPAIRLNRWFLPLLALASFGISSIAVTVPTATTPGSFNFLGASALGVAVYAILSFFITLIAQGTRVAKDRMMTTLVLIAFAIATTAPVRRGFVSAST